tara:strand:+ start:1172 stop:1543 length:372 start_codon:yes stop_codon:yes gene_type:complete
MTSSIPDSFNLDELQAMLDSAPSENEVSDSDSNSNSDSILDDVESAMAAVNRITDQALAHKLVAIQILHNLFEWHDAVGAKCIRNAESDQAKGWLKDAGKFQAIMNILQTISVDDDDFTVVRR